jgi:hypothetical protein
LTPIKGWLVYSGSGGSLFQAPKRDVRVRANIVEYPENLAIREKVNVMDKAGLRLNLKIENKGSIFRS